MTNEMAMLPNDYHPGPRCSCRECLRAYPEQPASNDLAVADLIGGVQAAIRIASSLTGQWRNHPSRMSLGDVDSILKEIERLQGLLLAQTKLNTQMFEAGRQDVLRSTHEPRVTPEEDREEYARVRCLSDEAIVSECMESSERVVRELANRYDVVVEKLEQESTAQPPGDVDRRVAELYDAALCSITFNLNEPVSAKEAQRALDAAKEIK